MKLTNYIYHGPHSSATLRVGDEELDISLFPDCPVSLPADHDYTQMLLAQKRLTLPSPSQIVKVAKEIKAPDTKAVKEVK